MKISPSAAAIFASAAFAVADLCVRAAGTQVGILLLLGTANVVLAAVAILGLKVSKESFWPKNWASVLGAAVCRLLAMVGSVWALAQMQVASYYLLLYLYPIWATFAGGWLFGEYPAKFQLLGIPLALAGCFLVFGGGKLELNMGVVWAVFVSLCLAGQILFLRRAKEHNALQVGLINALASLGGIVVLSLFMPVWPAETISLKGILYIVLATLAWVLGPLASFYAASRLKTFVYALWAYFQIPVAIAGAWLFFGEVPSVAVSVGLSLLIVGVIISQIPSRKHA